MRRRGSWCSNDWCCFVLHRSIPCGEPFPRFFRAVLEWPHAAAIGDPPALVDYVNPLRPRGVRVIGCVVHVIDTKWQWKLESLDEIVCDGHTLLQCFRLRVADVVLHVGLHLPFVGRMGLAHVHRQKIRMVFVITVDLNDVADLATKRRSSETPKNKP